MPPPAIQKDLFKEKAKTWDSNVTADGLSASVSSAIIKNVQLNEKMTVMDFGAGTGLISSHIIPYINKITAVDISEAMLQKLQSKPEFKGKLEIICRDIIDNPINKQFDLIVSAMALHHVEDTNKLIETFFSHLKSGAMIALADLDKEDGTFHPEDIEGVFHDGFDRDSLQNILESNGFSNINFCTAYTANKNEKDYPVFLVVAKKS